VSWAIWITGRPGSGKSTIARQLASALERRGQRPAVLEASDFAAELIPGRAPSAHELDIVHRALIRTAAELTRAGVPVVIDATAHRRAWREHALEAIARFAEVQLVCPDESRREEQSTRWNQMLSVERGGCPAEPDIVLDYSTRPGRPDRRHPSSARVVGRGASPARRAPARRGRRPPLRGSARDNRFPPGVTRVGRWTA
jgi:energy-coupling factor transporter ATP-binding protein EcfA2